MTLNKPLKVLIGILTLLVFLQPFVYFLSWVLMVLVFPIFMGNASSYPPFQAMNFIIPIVFPWFCLSTIVMYGMIIFYVVHSIKNQGVSDIVRIVTLLMIFFLPYIGMPFYYILFILMAKPPLWAMKPQPSGN